MKAKRAFLPHNYEDKKIKALGQLTTHKLPIAYTVTTHIRMMIGIALIIAN